MAIDPPATVREAALVERLRDALAAKGDDYTPRTALLNADGSPKYINRLILEPSPYLLQHAHNPVDWRPWGEEALAEALERDVPVFLSVGYATCHWCHVMEEESFDNEVVAAVLNAHFIPIKIDREQRPDLDQLYITATHLQQGHAGWPNTVFLRGDGVPFHTGTYFPRDAFLDLLAGVRQTWDDKREEVDGVAIRFNDALRRQHKIDAPDSAPPNEETFKAATLQLVQLHNAEEGGFSDSQQFPQEGFLLFLLDHWRRTGEEQARAAVATTLEAIAAGGIHDHIGGGFHRYTVDPNWRTPHFEKMLYNQALLARAFIEGWEATARPAFRRAAERAFTYVLRDMTDPEGAFYAAEDADSSDRSEKVEEGAFYVWPIEYVRATLGRTAERAIAALGLDRGATVEAGPVAHLRPGERVDFEALDPVLARLLKARAGRQRPLRDDKIIAGWNGLMIRALAEGAVAFGRADLAEAALRAAETLWQRHWDGERLWRLWVGETACEAGLLDDYAWFGLGCLALHEATAEPLWLERATTLAETAVAVFADDAHRLKMAAEDGPLGPIYESADGATPAGESAMLELLARLGGETGAAEMLIRAGELRAAIAPQMVQFPLMRPEALMASRIMDQGRSTLRRVLSQGRVRAQLKPASGGLGWRLMLSIAEGWHLNAHEPGPNWLVGATIEGADTEWPEGRAQTMDFSETEVAVYTGLVEIDLMPEAPELKLRVQACSERVCLEPVSTIFRLP